MDTTHHHPRLYAVEFLRIFFILAIIVGHAYSLRAEFADTVLSFFHTKAIVYAMGVEFFFIIGGFFLYRRIKAANDVWSHIKKTYMRLLPCMAFAFILCVAARGTSFYYFPTILTFSGGIGLNEVNGVGAGEWFISVYFWVTCLMAALFAYFPRKVWFILGVGIYLIYCIQAHVKVEDGYFPAYYGAVGARLTRGIASMGLGLIAGFFAEKLSFPGNKWSRLFFTVLEGFCLLCVWNCIMNPRHCHFDYRGIQIFFAVFLVSVSHSWGYVSWLLNRASWIQRFSRYTLPTLIGQMVMMRTLTHYNCFGMGGAEVMCCVVGGGMMLGVLEYHLVERSSWVCRLRGELCGKSRAR